MRLRRPLLILLTATGLCVAARAALVVNGGSQGKRTAVGAVNDVWADADPPNAVFDRWVGDTALLADPYAWHTTATIPAGAGAVTATFRPAPGWAATSYILNGRAPTDPKAVYLVYHFPANPVGVIFLFHGSGGSASGWFSRNVENLTFARDAVAGGYAVVALDSTDRVARQWDSATTSGNLDVVNVQAAINYLSGLGLMTSATPKFALGMSNGGAFAPKPAYYLGFNGCAIFCASGQPVPLFTFTPAPTVWSLQRNDDIYDHTTNLRDATANLAALQAQQPPVAGELRENPPSAVYPRRFARIPDLSVADSQAVYDGLKNGGFLDANDFLLADPDTSGWESAVPAVYTPYHGDLLDQLACCYSAHKFFSDYDNRVIQFFGQRRPPAPGRGGINQIVRGSAGKVQVTVGADPGQTYRIQASGNLGSWTTLSTNVNAPGTFDFVDVDAPGYPRRFYRTLSP